MSKSSLQQFRPGIDEVIKLVAKHFGVEPLSLTESQRGRQEDNVLRWVVMYLGQELCGLSLRKIADRLGLKRTGSIPNMVGKLKIRMASESKLFRQIDKIKSQYDT